MNLLRLVSLVVLVSLISACGNNHPTAPTSPPAPEPVPTPPALTISCPQSVTASTLEGTTVPVSFSQPTATGGVAPLQVSCTREPGSMFGGGTTSVQCTVTDAAGQSTSCLFTVTVTVLAPRLARTKFLAFGDSLTAGEMGIPTSGTSGRQYRMIIEPTLAYPTKLRTALRARYTTQAAGIEVINGGWPGEWAQDGAKRLEQVLPALRPEVVIILEGINDLASTLEHGIRPAAIAIDRMAREARGRGANVMLATLPPSRPPGAHAVDDWLIRELNSRIRGIATGENAVLVDLYEGMSSDVGRYIGPDGLHPTEAGYERIAELMLLAIRSHFEGGAQ
jgi:lysophospholipase L1-like esterase